MHSVFRKFNRTHLSNMHSSTT